MAEVNKSAEIRQYKQAHPRQKPKQIAEALGEQGIEVSAQFVSTVLSTAKKKKRKTAAGKSGRASAAAARKPGRPRGPRAAAPVNLNALLRAKQIVHEMGGIQPARQALDALEELMER